MKTKSVILVSAVLALTLLLLNSCIVKSLHPFYTKDTTFFEKRFIGNWKDNKKNNWKIISLKEETLKDNAKDSSEFSLEEGEEFEKYKDAYIFEYDKETVQFFAINIDKIKTIEGNRINISEHTIPIGQKYKSDFLKALKYI